MVQIFFLRSHRYDNDQLFCNHGLYLIFLLLKHLHLVYAKNIVVETPGITFDW